MSSTVAPFISEASWGPVLVAAARAGGRALVVGCGGHALFRFVAYHLVPLVLRHLRRRRRAGRRPQMTPPLLPPQADAEAKEKEETDGPVVTPRRAGDTDEDEEEGKAMARDDAAGSSRCGSSRLAWLWDGAQNRESLRLGTFLASSTSCQRPTTRTSTLLSP
jgi:hypothetical protein